MLSGIQDTEYAESHSYRKNGGSLCLTLNCANVAPTEKPKRTRVNPSLSVPPPQPGFPKPV